MDFLQFSFSYRLHEFYLSPILRVGTYVRLLSWMKANTPHDNPDREDITLALNTFKQVDTVIRQVRTPACTLSDVKKTLFLMLATGQERVNITLKK